MRAKITTGKYISYKNTANLSTFIVLLETDVSSN